MSARRSILLLGGSRQQVVAIERARDLGLRTVLCDYLPDNPGRLVADSFHLVSTTDREAVLAVARAEGVSGALAYASDPAAPTAAYVAEAMGLPGNSFRSVSALCDKSKFREFLRRHGFNCPETTIVDAGCDRGEVEALVSAMKCPVVVKPIDSSGSKGVNVLDGPAGMAGAIGEAAMYSRTGKVIVESFVEAGPVGAVEAEVFVCEGKVLFWGLMTSVRGRGVNPLVPTISLHPAEVPTELELKIKAEIQRMVAESGISNGPMNVEMIVDENEEVYFIDVGPRNGGNLLAEFFSLVSGNDMVEATVRCAMGETVAGMVGYDGRPSEKWVQHILGCPFDGTFGGLSPSYANSPYLRKAHVYRAVGEKVVPFDNASGAVGIAFLAFPKTLGTREILETLDDACVVSPLADPAEMLGSGVPRPC